MIKPTVGRVVWFCPSHGDPLHSFVFSHGDGRSIRLAAIVAWVHSDRMVNLAIFDPSGVAQARTSVPLLQDGDPPSPYSFCEWMPYQKGQAAKTEAAEAKADAAALDVSALDDGGRIYGAAAGGGKSDFGRLPPGATLAEGFTESGPAEPIGEPVVCECAHPGANDRDSAGVWHCCHCGRLSHSVRSGL